MLEFWRKKDYISQLGVIHRSSLKGGFWTDRCTGGWMPTKESVEDVVAEVTALKAALSEYANKIAGVGCPTDCKNFSPASSNGGTYGCTLEVATPLDCMDGNFGDLARWLVANGWRRLGEPTRVTGSTEVSPCARQPKVILIRRS